MASKSCLLRSGMCKRGMLSKPLVCTRKAGTRGVNEAGSWQEVRSGDIGEKRGFLRL